MWPKIKICLPFFEVTICVPTIGEAAIISSLVHFFSWGSSMAVQREWGARKMLSKPLSRILRLLRTKCGYTPEILLVRGILFMP